MAGQQVRDENYILFSSVWLWMWTREGGGGNRNDYDDGNIDVLEVWIHLSPEDVNCSSCLSVEKDCAARGFSSLDELCDDCVGGGISGEDEGQG